MIKEALQYIVGMKEAQIVELNGRTYTDKRLFEVAPERNYARSFAISTLSSLMDYLNDNPDHIDLEKVILHIFDYKTIEVFSTLDSYKSREYFITCKAKTPEFEFQQFYDAESFNIALQSLFCSGGDRDTILSIVGNVKTNNVNTASDNGVTQTVQTKKGIVLGEDTIIPNPVSLAPYRTFAEVNQPMSSFVFRAREREGSKAPEFALFEADGGTWKLIAVQRIKEYVIKHLIGRSLEKITILA